MPAAGGVSQWLTDTQGLSARRSERWLQSAWPAFARRNRRAPMGMGGSPIFCVCQLRPGRTARVNRREQELEKLLAPTVHGLGCELWGVEHHPAGRGAVLRVYIDAPEGVTVDDCERVSHQLSGVLEVEAPIAADYTLEVSSPGLDRVLFKPSQYPPYIGAAVDVRLKFPMDGRRRFVGRLAKASGETVVLNMDGAEATVPMAQIQRTRIVPEYEPPTDSRGQPAACGKGASEGAAQGQEQGSRGMRLAQEREAR